MSHILQFFQLLNDFRLLKIGEDLDVLELQFDCEQLVGNVTMLLCILVGKWVANVLDKGIDKDVDHRFLDTIPLEHQIDGLYDLTRGRLKVWSDVLQVIERMWQLDRESLPIELVIQCLNNVLYDCDVLAII